MDPFESIYHPQNRIKTVDRITTAEPAISKSEAGDTEAEKSLVEHNIAAMYDFPVDLKNLSQDFEIDLIKQALADSQYNQKKTADKLSLTYHQLRGYLKKYNLLDSTGEEME